MKIEIDLDEVKDKEDGVKEAVIQLLFNYFKEELSIKSYGILDRVIKETVGNEVKEHLQKIVAAGLEFPYKVVDEYGCNNGETTIRDTVKKIITEQCKYYPDQREANKNVFTKNIDNEIQKQIENFRFNFMDDVFIKELNSSIRLQIENRIKTMSVNNI